MGSLLSNQEIWPCPEVQLQKDHLWVLQVAVVVVVAVAVAVLVAAVLVVGDVTNAISHEIRDEIMVKYE